MMKTARMRCLIAAALAVPLAAKTAYAQSAPPAPPPLTNWTGSVALGLTLTKGNSDTLLATLTARADKKWQQNELSLGADASYGETEDVKNNETLRGYGQYNRIFDERWFGYLRAEALHDAIADVDYRFTVSPGLGYYFIKNPKTFLSAELGPGYIYEKQGEDTHSYATLRLAERFEHRLNDRARIFESVEVLPQVDNFENYIINAEVGVESALTKAWTLRLVLQDTYDNEPAPGREQNDLKLIGALVWKF